MQLQVGEPRTAPRAQTPAASRPTRDESVHALLRGRNGRAGARASSLAAVAVAAGALITAAPAHAAPAAVPTVNLNPGTALTIGNEMCTAGFVARNQHGAPDHHRGTTVMITTLRTNALLDAPCAGLKSC